MRDVRLSFLDFQVSIINALYFIKEEILKFEYLEKLITYIA